MCAKKHSRPLVKTPGPVLFYALFFTLFFMPPLLFSLEEKGPYVHIDSNIVLPYGRYRGYELQEGIVFRSHQVSTGISHPPYSIFFDYREYGVDYAGLWNNENLSEFSAALDHRSIGLGGSFQYANLELRGQGNVDVNSDGSVQPAGIVGLKYLYQGSTIQFTWARCVFPITYSYTVPSQNFSDTKKFNTTVSSLSTGIESSTISVRADIFWSEGFESPLKPWKYDLDLVGFYGSADFHFPKVSTSMEAGYTNLKGQIFHEVSPYVSLENLSAVFVKAGISGAINNRFTLIFNAGGIFSELGEGSRLDTVPFITGGGFYPIRFYADNMSASLSGISVGCKYEHPKIPFSLTSTYYVTATPLHSEYLQKVYDNYPISFHYEKKEGGDISPFHHGLLLSADFGDHDSSFTISAHQYVPVSNIIEELRTGEEEGISPAKQDEARGTLRWGGFGISCSLKL